MDDFMVANTGDSLRGGQCHVQGTGEQLKPEAAIPADLALYLLSREQ